MYSTASDLATRVPSDFLLDLVISQIHDLCHPSSPIGGDTRLQEIPTLDSLQMVELVLGLERTLGRPVDFDRLDRVVAVRDLASAFQIN